MPKKAKWNEIPCPACKEPISPSATKCPYCQTEFPPEQVAARVKNHRQGIGVGCLVLLLAVLGLGYCGSQLEEPSVVVENSTAAASEASAVAEEKSVATAAKPGFIGLWRDVLRLAKPCDQLNSAAIDAVAKAGAGSASLVDAYGIASDAQKTCQETWLAIGRLSPPDGLSKEQEKATKKALDACDTAYFSRKESLETMLEVIDGDQRPSKVQTYKERGELAQSGILVCIAGLTGVAGELGVNFDEIK